MNQCLARNPRLWLDPDLAASQSLLAQMHSVLMICQVLFEALYLHSLVSFL